MWQCAKCRKDLEDRLDVCWNCGTLKNGVEDPGFCKADNPFVNLEQTSRVDPLQGTAEKNPFLDFEPGMSDASLISPNKQQTSASEIKPRHVPAKGYLADSVSLSPVGAIVGGVVGAVVRPTAVYFAVGEQLQEVYVGSAVIGLFVGVLSGLAGRPLAGAVLGSVLAAVMYCFSVIPLLIFMCLASKQWGQDPPAWWLIAFTGAVAGGSGGLAGRISDSKRARAELGPVSSPNDQPMAKS